MPANYPYPTPFEILRYILRSFDFKLPEKDKKHLDDMATKRVYDPREFNIALEKYFSNVANKYIGSKATNLISNHLVQFFDEYLHNIVGVIPADGLSRNSVMDILIKSSIKDSIAYSTTVFHQKIGGPHPSFWFSSGIISIDTVLTWLSDHESLWDSHLANIKKERRDMIAAWRKGDVLPSAQSLHLLSQTDTPNDNIKNSIDWDLIKPLLFIARSIDFIKREEFGRILISEARLALWGAESKVDVRKEIRSKQTNLLWSIGTAQSLMASLQSGLRPTVEKSKPEQYRSIIHQVRTLINTSEELQCTRYWIDWHDARWHVFSGDLKAANNLYKSAFEKSSFVAGDNQKYIVEEAIIVAASQPTPDKVFLKQLKWAQINFGYDIPSITESAPSHKVSETIEDWEVELWKSSFYHIFPKSGYFPGTEYNSLTIAQGPLLISDPSKIKPDYRHPNRTMKIGETWQRTMPQLVWFALNEDVEVCRKLIDHGADVNVQSAVGDTPILLALEAMNVTEVEEGNIFIGGPIYRSLNDETFRLLSSVPHAPKTINTRTQKKRLLPIISAVESGQIDVVKTILGMGADPNGRGKTDEQTPLNVCLKLIGILKNPELGKKHQTSMPVTPEALDSIRRQAQGLSGFTLDQQKQSLENFIDSGLYGPIQQFILDLMYQNIHQHMDINELREIASLLINSGANVNADHASPIKGYTPLMLAVELDERAIFEQMLVFGGDIKKTYKDSGSDKNISILEIARYFQSTSVMQVLKDISPYATVY